MAKAAFRAATRRASAGPTGKWVVGPAEIANMVHSIASGVPGVSSAMNAPHPFYANTYDYDLVGLTQGSLFPSLKRAKLFGEIVANHAGIIYLGQNAFLGAQDDFREFEFRFITERGRHLVVMFTGSDIRSPEVMREIEERTGRPNIATYLRATAGSAGSREHERVLKVTADRAVEYADAIVTASVDQAGYLPQGTEPFRYFFPDENVSSDLSKFDSGSPRVVLHAPSSPILKGTPLVRAAVESLRAEGLEFEYVELTGASHEQVQAELARAHIVLNQFYAYVPGVFGVEAMAAGAVMLTSADENIEPDLPRGSNEAWVVTQHFEVERKLRELLLADAADLSAQAARGQKWVREHAVASVSSQAMRELLDRIENRGSTEGVAA
ncbi:MAG: glycosyltransferase [Leucobacter sp.]